MKILSLSFHGCIRTIKESIALRDAGISVRHMVHHFANDDLKVLLSDCCFYSTADDLKQSLAFMDDIDLIHVHNEPTWIVSAAKDARPDLPVVFDVHDLAGQQEPGGYNYDSRLMHEASAFRVADGCIFPSFGYQDKVTMEYGLTRPSMVLFPYCNRDLLFLQPLPRIGGIVYEGGVIAPRPTAHGAIDADITVEYRNHLDLTTFLTSKNIPFAIYGIGKAAHRPYTAAGALCFPMMPYFSMMRQITRYDWGFVGAAKPNRAIQDCMPNKMFEYLMAGIPVIVCNAEEAGRFAEEHGVGIHVKSIEEIPERYGEWEALKKRVLDIRHDLVMENRMEDVLRFYDSVQIGHGARKQKELLGLGVKP